MKQPDLFEGLADKDHLSVAGQGDKTKRNIARPSELVNAIHEPPSIIPGVAYPLTGRERQILKYAWRHCRELARRGLIC